MLAEIAAHPRRDAHPGPLRARRGRVRARGARARRRAGRRTACSGRSGATPPGSPRARAPAAYGERRGTVSHQRPGGHHAVRVPGHQRRFAHHRTARLLHRAHRPGLPGPGAAHGHRPEARRPVRRARDEEPDRHRPRRRRRQGRRGAHRVRRPVRRDPPIGMGRHRTRRRPGPRRGVGGDHLPDHRDDDLQPPRRRLQAGVLPGLQPLDHRVLRRGPATACSAAARPRCAASTRASPTSRRSPPPACAA